MNMTQKAGLLLPLLMVILLTLLWGCDLENTKTAKSDGVWVFLTLRYESNDGFQFNYYYGEMNKKLYNKIANNLITKGFFKLNKVRYWNNDDKLELYADDVYSGNMVFRIEDIRKLNELKDDPVLTNIYEELSETAKSLRDSTQVEENLNFNDTE